MSRDSVLPGARVCDDGRSFVTVVLLADDAVERAAAPVAVAVVECALVGTLCEA